MNVATNAEVTPEMTLPVGIFRDAIDQEIRTCLDTIADREHAVEECRSLSKRLDKLPRKLEHPIMAPVCGVGFYPATLIHTNEIMISIGDNYAVECSTFTAQKILDKRIKAHEKAIDEANRIIESRKEKLRYFETLFGKELEPGMEIEIREKYDESTEEALKQRRREAIKQKSDASAKTKKVDEPKQQRKAANDVVATSAAQMPGHQRRRQQQKQRQQKQQPSFTPSTSQLQYDDDESVFRRLEELELQERAAGELEEDYEERAERKGRTTGRTSGEKEKEDESTSFKPIPGVSKEEYQKVLDLVEQLASSSSDEGDNGTEGENEENEDLDSDDLPEEKEEEKVEPACAESKEKPRSKLERKKSVTFAEELEHVKMFSNAETNTTYSEISVVDAHAAAKSPSSILRSTSPTPVDLQAIQEADRMIEGVRNLAESSCTAFPGLVVERDPMSSAMADQLASLQKDEAQAGQKKVSKFRQSRSRQ